MKRIIAMIAVVCSLSIALTGCAKKTSENDSDTMHQDMSTDSAPMAAPDTMASDTTGMMH